MEAKKDCLDTLNMYLDLLIFIRMKNIKREYKERITYLIKDVYNVHESFVCISKNFNVIV